MMSFFDFLFPPREDELVVRGITTDAFLSLLLPSLVLVTKPETVALLPFSHPQVRAVIHEAKYHGNKRALELLGLVLHEYLKDLDTLTRPPIIVPVPLGKNRRRSRGFNQVTEVVRRAIRQTQCKLDENILIRVRETVSQISLPRTAREENMRGAFQVVREIDPERTYLMVDDVATTGATLQAAVDALHSAHASHVTLLALAH